MRHVSCTSLSTHVPSDDMFGPKVTRVRLRKVGNPEVRLAEKGDHRARPYGMMPSTGCSAEWGRARQP